MYQKEIIYLNLFDNGIKSRCVGYLKLEKKQEKYNVELQVKNVPAKLSGKYPIRLQGGNDWKEADMLEVRDGIGKWEGNMEEAVLRAEILLTDSYRIKGASKAAQTEKDEEELPAERVKDENSRRDELNKPVNEDVKVESDKPVRMAEQDAARKERQRSMGRPTGPQYKKSESGINALYESKWEQLLATYEQLHPYGDSRVYIKLEPKDFIVLRSNYQHLVNNSFLLHGFYNYRYVILGKEKEFYLGVPGVFYEREKMVALMFGFEAFECEGGEAEEGKFGYYLRKVEI